METTPGFPLPRRAALRTLVLCVCCGLLLYVSLEPTPAPKLTHSSWTILLFWPSPSPSIVPVIHHPPLPPPRPFNDSKVALLIEDRPVAHLAPLLLHMISVVPSDWRFVFLGGAESVAFLNRSRAVRAQVGCGKLDLRELPTAFSAKGQEPISQTLTSLAFWRWLGGADTWSWEHPYVEEEQGVEGRRPQVEWVLLFQTDSILCANSQASLNDWLHYDWVGAPW